MKQTAMQELINKINKMESKNINVVLIWAHQQLKKEKEQIIEAINSHDKDCIRTTNNVICKLKPSCKMLFEYDGKAGIEYYNKTFTT